jgi:2-C-methyl-D-erythritol 4-phosphate cytidylyltransferase
MPVRDTMKRTNAKDGVSKTVERTGLWHAFTPQMFRLGLLRQALSDAIERNLLVTDEASALELAGLQPLMVAGHADNIKITRPEDLVLAGFYLQQQQREGEE